MVFYIISRAISVLVAFLFPAYETFKTLANRPGYENQSARWLMYWAVIGVLAAWEYSFEFLISWFPFYHEVKTLFLLFMVLPQVQGSTIIYQQLLLPQLIQNEALIDQQIASLHTRFLAVLQDQFQKVLQTVTGYQATAAAANVQEGPRGIQGLGGAPAGSPQRPGMGSPTSSGIPPAGGAAAVQAVQAMWRTYGPTVMATGAAAFRPAGAPEPTLRDGQASRSDAPLTPPRMPNVGYQPATPPVGYAVAPSFPQPQYSPST